MAKDAFSGKTLRKFIKHALDGERLTPAGKVNSIGLVGGTLIVLGVFLTNVAFDMANAILSSLEKEPVSTSIDFLITFVIFVGAFLACALLLAVSLRRIDPSDDASKDR